MPSGGVHPINALSRMSIIQRLHDTEINLWITSFFDDRVYVRLGD